jgi:hypothetical protein
MLMIQWLKIKKLLKHCIIAKCYRHLILKRRKLIDKNRIKMLSVLVNIISNVIVNSSERETYHRIKSSFQSATYDNKLLFYANLFSIILDKNNYVQIFGLIGIFK